MEEKTKAITAKLEGVLQHITALEGGKKVSATRARGDLMDVIKDSKILRADILAFVKALPVKERRTPSPEVDV